MPPDPCLWGYCVAQEPDDYYANPPQGSFPPLPSPPPLSDFTPLPDPQPSAPAPAPAPPLPPPTPESQPNVPKVWPNMPPNDDRGKPPLYVIGFLTFPGNNLRMGGWFLHGDPDICAVPPQWFKRANSHDLPRAIIGLSVAGDYCDYEEIKGKSYGKAKPGDTVGKIVCDHYKLGLCAKATDGKVKGIAHYADDAKYGEQADAILENAVTCAWDPTWSTKVVESNSTEALLESFKAMDG